MQSSSRPSTPPQRSTRAPAEGVLPDQDLSYDAAPADAGGEPQERSPRAPAEGRPKDTAARHAAPDCEGRQCDEAGSGNSLGDGRTAGGGYNADKRKRLSS
ncbi:hypothetical protein OOT46_23625 [Aquabacterium sp. A7-Y]|uniref:hypothetical protein n=1 Tax=Aquabacterium sp. A7-Y TaxID=1349605 RepID=UPI00223D91E6|nr:hypothetical protein [Aquabacterium sp. A7-Y]MCW7540814.1 hypothetical protein [Aquabacterium sp. A7-Y]